MTNLVLSLSRAEESSELTRIRHQLLNNYNNYVYTWLSSCNHFMNWEKSVCISIKFIYFNMNYDIIYSYRTTFIRSLVHEIA